MAPHMLGYMQMPPQQQMPIPHYVDGSQYRIGDGGPFVGLGPQSHFHQPLDSGHGQGHVQGHVGGHPFLVNETTGAPPPPLMTVAAAINHPGGRHDGEGGGNSNAIGGDDDGDPKLVQSLEALAVGEGEAEYSHSRGTPTKNSAV
jgi:hypothetical protein